MLSKTLYLAMSLTLLILGTSCDGATTSTSVEVILGNPNPCEAQSGSNIPVTVRGSIANDASILWEASPGGFTDETKIQTTYLAPQVDQETLVQISVSISQGNQSVRETAECIILPAPGNVVQSDPSPEIVTESPTNTPTISATETLETPINTEPTPTATTVEVTPTAPATGIDYTPGAIARAEVTGQCGEAAFDGNIALPNPTFKRPDGHTSGWISADPATVMLPDGSTMEFVTQFVLIVEDLASVQIENANINDQGNANVFGCWFREDDSELVANDATAEYQKKISYGQFADIYLATDSSFTPFDPESELDVAYRTIPGFAINGIEWCAQTSSTYAIAYEKGAYSAWPSDAQCPNNECWKTAAFIYKNREIEWVEAEGVEEPRNADLVVGWDFPAQATEGEVIDRSRTLRPQSITMQDGDCLLFVPKDGRQSYAGNRGDVTISIYPVP